jgi:peptidoglycan lytic transglycosylase
LEKPLVTNLDNGKPVEVWVNGRGPFARNFILGLSDGGAQWARGVGDGVTRVRLRLPGSAA